jgi:hypothetical protein
MVLQERQHQRLPHLNQWIRCTIGRSFIFPDCGGDLKFKLLVGKVKQLMKNEQLEHDQRIDPLAPCITLALLSISPVKKRTE